MFWGVKFHLGEKKYDLSVLPDGTIVLFFSELPTVDGGQAGLLRVMRSADKGATWSARSRSPANTTKPPAKCG